MRILLLTPDPPSPNHINGGTTRQYHLYKRLIELGHEVVVVAPFPYVEDPYVEALRSDGFEVHELQRPKSRLSELLGAIVRRPSLIFAPFHLSFQSFVGAVYWARLRPIVDRVASGGGFDAVCVEQEFASSWITAVPDAVARILTSQQIESAYNFDRAARRTGLSRRLALLNAKRCVKSEKKWTAHYDAVVCMSQNEIRLLTETAGKLPPHFVIGNGADTEWLGEIGPDPDQNVVLFTGTMAFEPNAVGAQWLAREVWPLVLAEVPDAKLQLVGRNPGPEVASLDQLENVNVHASVPDMKPFFAGASICTLPMLEGGGTRLKLAEGMAAGRAIVATPNGATGVEVTDGEDVVVADGVERFAAELIRLLGDRDERLRLGTNARATCRRILDWKALGDQWEAAIRETVEAKRQAS